MLDVLEEEAESERKRIWWLISSSPHDPGTVAARYDAIEKGTKKEAAIDDFMEKVSANKKLRTDN